MGRRGLWGSGGAALLWAAVILTAAPARADDTFAVLDVRAVHGDDLFARLLTDALREQMGRVPGLRETDRGPSVDTVESVEGCDADRACIAKALGDNLRADWIVFGTLRRAEDARDDAFHATLYLYSVRDDAYAASIVAPIPPFDRRTMSQRAAAYAHALARKAELVPEDAAAALARVVPRPEAVRGAGWERPPGEPAETDRIGRRARLLRVGGGMVLGGAVSSIVSFGLAAAREDALTTGGAATAMAFFGLGMMTSAMGSVVIGAGASYDDEPERRDVAVTPAVGPDGASVTGRVTF